MGLHKESAKENRNLIWKQVPESLSSITIDFACDPQYIHPLGSAFTLGRED